MKWTDMMESTMGTERTKVAKPKDKWVKPPAGKLKLNVDVSVTSESEISMGFIIRNDHGTVALAARDGIRASGSITLLKQQQ